MRTRLNNITFTSGTRSITTGITSLTIDDIRLIVNESQNKVICSSMQKNNITNISSGVITYSSTIPVLASGDHITFEVDLGDNGAKQGTNPDASLTSIDEKIDDFYDTFDADIASQLYECIGDDEESDESDSDESNPSQSEVQLSRLRNLQESYDALAGNTITSPVAEELSGGKKAIVNAINYMGGSATTDMTLAQLAQQIQSLDILSPLTTVTAGTPRPINLADFAVGSTQGFVKIYSENVITTRSYVFSNISTIKSIELPNLSSTLNPFSGNCANLEEIIIPNAITLSQNVTQNNSALLKLNILNAKNVPSNYMLNGTHNNLIDIICGKGISSNFALNPSYSPANCYLTTSSSLCFDTDLQEYGQVFNTNFDKWKWCIINHFAENLQDRTGLTAYTITFGSTALSHFDAEMIAAFTDKNWTLA